MSITIDEHALRLAASAPAGDAVAWQWRYKGASLDQNGPCWSVWLPIEYSIESWRVVFADKIDRGTVECRPLYARPPAPAVEVREALEIFTAHYQQWMDNHPDDAECIVHSKHTFGDLRRARRLLASTSLVVSADQVEALVKKMIPAAVIFADCPAHVQDLRERAAKELRAVLSASPREMGLKSDGGVEGHALGVAAAPIQTRTAPVNDATESDPLLALRAENPEAGIKPGPSEPSSSTSETAGEEVRQEWRTDAKPTDGRIIDVRAVSSFRYAAYKPTSEQRKRGIKGRWQVAGGYGGWDNCPEPRGDWRPNVPLPSPDCSGCKPGADPKVNS